MDALASVFSCGKCLEQWAWLLLSPLAAIRWLVQNSHCCLFFALCSFDGILLRITTQQGTSHRVYQQSISSKLHRNDQHHAAALNTTTAPAILQQWPLLPGVPPDQLPSQQRSNKAHSLKSSMCHMEISIQYKTTCQQLGDDTSSQSMELMRAPCG
ncbi:hypothetical protein Nepgr_014702 [Nepenthes gracilis]|uniref:Uncharacterized protein n=1 Tax=Nepenthes gracilis TaxID=150966 RepID=A0AAD3SLK0_NEPGR|nr:hypothetical protein Nepgr_014702 [Nepenthes gracilis]